MLTGGGWGSHRCWGPLCLPGDRPRAPLYLLPGTWWCHGLLTGCWHSQDRCWGCPPELGQVVAVSLLQLLPEALHLLPAMGDHQHHSTGTHTPYRVPLDGPKGTKPDFKARPLFWMGTTPSRSTLGSKPMFFPCTVLHQPGNPQENRACRAKELFPYTSPPHSVPRKAGRTDNDTQGCQATAPKPQAESHSTDLSLSGPSCPRSPAGP